MLELTPAQIAVLQRLRANGFTLVAFPLYGSAIGVRRGAFAALLVPVEGAGLRLFGEACCLIDGNLSARTTRQGSAVFVWKNKHVAVTSDLAADLERFSADLRDLLAAAP
jgi:hypothetical protein